MGISVGKEFLEINKKYKMFVMRVKCLFIYFYLGPSLDHSGQYLMMNLMKNLFILNFTTRKYEESWDFFYRGRFRMLLFA